MKKLLLSLCMVLALAACKDEQNSAQTKEKPVIKVGASLPLTGNLAQVGQAGVNAMEMALDKWKKLDTKYDYKLVIENDMMKPQQANLNVQKLINIDKVSAIMSLFGVVDRVVDDAANKQKVISMSCSYGKSDVPEYAINTGAQNEEIYDVALKQLRKENVKTVSLMGSNAAVSNGILDYFVKHLAQDGIKVLTDERYGLEERDYRISIQKSEALNPDYYLLMGVEPANSIWVKQYTELTGKKNFGSLGTFPQLQPGFWEYIENRWTVYLNGGTEEFVKEYNNRYNGATYGCTANMYDNLDILITAFENTPLHAGAKIPTTGDVINYIHNLKTWNGMFGEFKIDPSGIAHPKIDVRVYRDGKFIKVEE